MSWNFDRIEILGVLGQGSFGKIFRAKDTEQDREICVKKIRRDEEPILLKKEIEFHRTIHSANVIQFLGIIETARHAYLLLEYAIKGDLFDVTQEGVISESVMRKYFRDAALGIQSIHSLGYVHGDIKLENIVVDQNDVAKICDFGFVEKVGVRREFRVGTESHFSPEIVDEVEPLASLGDDCWALGVSIYKAILRSDPFNTTRDIRVIYYTISYAQSSELRTLMKKIFVYERFRPNIDEILESAWISGATS